jgi:CBS-domain-containing membrane protein
MPPGAVMGDEVIAAILLRDFPALGPDTPIRRAAALLVEGGFAAAPVLDHELRLVGILTQKDCFRPALHASYHREWSGRVADHMSGDVICVDMEDDLIRVAELFLACPHRVVPVMQAGRVAGMVRRSDVLAQLIRLG